MRYVGIDNGLHGAMAIISDDNENIEFIDPPLTKVTVKKASREVYDEKRLFFYIKSTLNSKDKAFIEETVAMPFQSSQSLKSIGYGEGLYIMALTALGISCSKVRIHSWQKHFGIFGKGKATKEQAYHVASKFFPNAKLKTDNGKLLDGRADALLIAEYGRRLVSGNANLISIDGGLI